MINQFDEVNNFLRITNKIIVFGEDTHNTLGIIRSIGTCGKSIFFVDCVDGDRSFVDYSKFIIKTYKVSSVKEGLDTVISVFGNEKEKPIIICTSDPIMSIIDLNYNILKDRFIVPNAGWQGAINELMDKSYMRRIAEKVGFKLPFSITISLPHFEETQLTRVPFPCFVKPSNSLDGNKKDMRICNNLTELKLHLKELVGRTHKVEIQEYIEKDYEFSILGCSLSSGKCLIPIFWIKKTEDPECPGNTAFGKCIKSLPDFDKEIVIRFFKEISLYIIAGEKKLDELRNVVLPKLKEQAQKSGEQLDAQKVNDMENTIIRFEKKIYDLKTTRIISIQMAPQIRLLQNSEAELVDKIQSSITNTIPLWKNQLVIALGINNARRALETQREVSNLTNDMLKKNSEVLKQGSIEIARESERAIVDIETVQKTNRDIIETLDTVIQIHADGRAKRAEAEKELINIEKELKTKLIEIQSGEAAEKAEEAAATSNTDEDDGMPEIKL